MKNKGKFGNKINKNRKNKVNELKSLGFSQKDCKNKYISKIKRKMHKYRKSKTH